MARKKDHWVVVCPYCGKNAEFVGGERIYPHRKDLYSKRFYACFPCKAWVGVHVGTKRPLGRLADAKLRRAKQAAHAAFDPIWKKGKGGRQVKRSEAYAWLAGQLGISLDECHIGMFDFETCCRVVALCELRRG